MKRTSVLAALIAMALGAGLLSLPGRPAPVEAAGRVQPPVVGRSAMLTSTTPAGPDATLVVFVPGIIDPRDATPCQDATAIVDATFGDIIKTLNIPDGMRMDFNYRTDSSVCSDPSQYNGNDTYADLLGAALALDGQLMGRLYQGDVHSIVMITHSLGGAVASEWIAALHASSPPPVPVRVITLDSPINGCHALCELAALTTAPFLGSPLGPELASRSVQAGFAAARSDAEVANNITVYAAANIEDAVVPCDGVAGSSVHDSCPDDLTTNGQVDFSATPKLDGSGNVRYFPANGCNANDGGFLGIGACHASILHPPLSDTGVVWWIDSIVSSAVTGSLSGGTWIEPNDGATITSNSVHLSAHAYPAPGLLPISHVNFTASVGGGSWRTVCPVSTPSPLSSDVYSCDWNLTGVLAGDIQVSFDVTDAFGGVTYAPNGVRTLHYAPAADGAAGHGYLSRVFAGDYSTCALVVDGRVECWGDVGDYVPTPVEGIPGPAIALSNAGTRICAVLATADVVCWSSTAPVPASVPGLSGQFTSVAVGNAHSCAVATAGGVKCWGDNSHGQLGDGTRVSSDSAVDVVGLTEGAVSVVVGDSHTCALTVSRRVECWGDNSTGQLGANVGTWSAVPVVVGGLGETAALSAGGSFTCAISTFAALRCWGLNSFGQLGNGTFANSTFPVDVRGLSNVLEISAGTSHACAITADRDLKCWGLNTANRLGSGTFQLWVGIPVDVPGVHQVVQVSSGGAHTCAVLQDSTECWGYNLYGQLGDGTQLGEYGDVRTGTWDSDPVVVVGSTRGSAATLAFSGYLPSRIIGQTLPSELTVEVHDLGGATVIADNTTQITLEVGPTNSGVVLSCDGGTTQTVSSGVARFRNCVANMPSPWWTSESVELWAHANPLLAKAHSGEFLFVTDKLSCGGRTWIVVLREHDTQDYTPDWRDENLVGCLGLDSGSIPDFSMMTFTNGRPLDNIVSEVAVASGHSATLCSEPGGGGGCGSYAGITDFVGWAADNRASSLYIDGPPAYWPAVTDRWPLTGPTAGGTVVTISGMWLTGATGVTFGGVPALSFTVDFDASITATAPAHAPGTVDIRIASANGTSVITGADTFTYVSRPTVTAVSPESGPATGGTAVTITGTGFTGTSSVEFGGVPAPGFTVNSDTSITSTAPSRPGGTIDVLVTNPAGTSIASPADQYTYVSSPAVTGLVPLSGQAAGGTLVTISGAGFTGANNVTFGGVPALNVIVNSDTSITATAPAHTAGIVDVLVTTPAGVSLASVADQFTYTSPFPTVTSVTPPVGAAGTVVAITGTGFLGVVCPTGVSFGGFAPLSCSVDSDTNITAAVPPGPSGAAVDVVVTAGGIASPVSSADLFTYGGAVGNPPTVTAISSTSGPPGLILTITGTGFEPTSAAAFVALPASHPAGATAAQFSYLSPTQGLVTVPGALLPGNAYYLVITSSTGSSDTTPSTLFYVSLSAPSPVWTNVSAMPQAVQPGGVVTFTAALTNVTTAAIVTDALPMSVESVQSALVTSGSAVIPCVVDVVSVPHLVTCPVPVADPAQIDTIAIVVRLRSDAPLGPLNNSLMLTGGWGAPLPAGFPTVNVAMPATVTGVTPLSGPTTGGTTLELDGSYFDWTTTSVTIDGIFCTMVYAWMPPGAIVPLTSTATQAWCVTGPHPTAGSWPVVVDGVTTPFVFNYSAPPVELRHVDANGNALPQQAIENYAVGATARACLFTVNPGGWLAPYLVPVDYFTNNPSDPVHVLAGANGSANVSNLVAYEGTVGMSAQATCFSWTSSGVGEQYLSVTLPDGAIARWYSAPDPNPPPAPTHWSISDLVIGWNQLDGIALSSSSSDALATGSLTKPADLRTSFSWADPQSGAPVGWLTIAFTGSHTRGDGTVYRAGQPATPPLGPPTAGVLADGIQGVSWTAGYASCPANPFLPGNTNGATSGVTFGLVGFQVTEPVACQTASTIDISVQGAGPGSSAPLVSGVFHLATGSPQITVSTDYVLQQDTTFACSGLVIAADNITIDLNGHWLVGPSPSFWFATCAGVTVTGRSGITIKNSKPGSGGITGFATGVLMNQGWSFDTGSPLIATANTVDGVTIQANRGSGVAIDGGNGNTVRNCVIAGNAAGGGAGILVDQGAHDNLVQGCRFESNGIGVSLGSPVFGSGASGNTITGNTIASSTNDALAIVNDSSGNTIQGNTISSNGGYGLELLSAQPSYLQTPPVIPHGNAISGNNILSSALGDMSDPSSGTGTSQTANTYSANICAVSTPNSLCTPPNPMPVLVSLSVSSAQVNTALTVTLTGSGYMPTSVVQINGAGVMTTFGSSTSLMATFTAPNTPQTLQVKVSNPAPGGGTSGFLTFFVTTSPVVVTNTNTVSVSGPGATTITVGGSPSAPQLAAVATGDGTVAVATFGGNPGSAPSFASSAGSYFDVYVAPTSHLTSLTVTYCETGSDRLYWLDPTNGWTLASPVTVSNGCVVLTVSDTSSPNLSQLGGTVLVTRKKDATPPVAHAAVTSGSLGGNGWYTTDVSVTWNWTDDDSGIDGTKCTAHTDSAPLGEGAVTLKANCADLAGNTTNASYTVKVDKTPPVLEPLFTPSHALLNGRLTVADGASDSGSGLATHGCGSVSTGKVGTFTVKCTATDGAGNTTTVSVPYTVAYAICVAAGDDRDDIGDDEAHGGHQAGSTVPVKVSLCDAAGKSVSSKSITVTAVDVTDADGKHYSVQPSGGAGNSLSFSFEGGKYSFILKTKGLAAGAYRLNFTAGNDPSVHTYQFTIRAKLGSKQGHG